MRISSVNLGLFIPGDYAVPQNPVIDPSGIGDFVPGSFAVPQNPVAGGGIGDFVPGSFAVPQTPVGLGDFVAGDFPVPQSPVGMGALVESAPLYPVPMNSVWAGAHAQGLAGLGCSCGGSCGSCRGMGDLQSTWNDIVSSLSSMSSTTYLAAGGALVLAYLLFARHGAARSEYAEKKKQLKADYQQRLRRLRDEFPTAARRIRRSTTAAAEVF